MNTALQNGDLFVYRKQVLQVITRFSENTLIAFYLRSFWVLAWH